MTKTLARLFTAVSVLALASTAHAECAWVLWEGTVSGRNRSATEPVRTYSAKADCDRALSDTLAAFTSGPGVVVRKDAKYQEVYVTIGPSTIVYHYVCLPDTVDPRDPKEAK